MIRRVTPDLTRIVDGVQTSESEGGTLSSFRKELFSTGVFEAGKLESSPVDMALIANTDTNITFLMADIDQENFAGDLSVEWVDDHGL